MVPITKPIKEIISKTTVTGKDKVRDNEEMHSPQISMEQLQQMGEMWPPMQGVSSTQSTPIGGGSQISMRNQINVT